MFGVGFDTRVNAYSLPRILVGKRLEPRPERCLESLFVQIDRTIEQYGEAAKGFGIAPIIC